MVCAATEPITLIVLVQWWILAWEEGILLGSIPGYKVVLSVNKVSPVTVMSKSSDMSSLSSEGQSLASQKLKSVAKAVMTGAKAIAKPLKKLGKLCPCAAPALQSGLMQPAMVMSPL